MVFFFKQACSPGYTTGIAQHERRSLLCQWWNRRLFIFKSGGSYETEEFFFWNLTMEYETLIHMFVRPIVREISHSLFMCYRSWCRYFFFHSTTSTTPDGYPFPSGTCNLFLKPSSMSSWNITVGFSQTGNSFTASPYTCHVLRYVSTFRLFVLQSQPKS